jgi:hypothetical protein
VTYQAQFGSKSADGKRIKELVTVIEDVGDARIV